MVTNEITSDVSVVSVLVIVSGIDNVSSFFFSICVKLLLLFIKKFSASSMACCNSGTFLGDITNSNWPLAKNDGAFVINDNGNYRPVKW